jgi:hypothetical protein
MIEHKVPQTESVSVLWRKEEHTPTQFGESERGISVFSIPCWLFELKYIRPTSTQRVGGLLQY